MPIPPQGPILGWPPAASPIPPPDGAVDLDVPDPQPEGRTPLLARFRTRTVVLTGALVVLLAGVATLGGLLIQTRGVLSDTQQNLAFTHLQLTGTQAELSSTKADLASTKADLASTKADLTNTQGDLRKARAQLSTETSRADGATKAANDLGQCIRYVSAAVNDIYAWDDSQYRECMSAIDEWKALRGLSGNDGASA